MYGGRIPKLNWAFLIGVTLGKKDMYNLKNQLNTGTRLLRHCGRLQMYSTFKVGDHRCSFTCKLSNHSMG